jgi:hypothetical protein
VFYIAQFANNPLLISGFEWLSKQFNARRTKAFQKEATPKIKKTHSHLAGPVPSARAEILYWGAPEPLIFVARITVDYAMISHIQTDRVPKNIRYPRVNLPFSAWERLTQPSRKRAMKLPGGMLAMSEEKELYLGWTAILFFAMALVYFQQ